MWRQTSPAISPRLSNNQGGNTLGVTTNVQATQGVATFDDLTINTAGTGYNFVLSSARSFSPDRV